MTMFPVTLRTLGIASNEMSLYKNRLHGYRAWATINCYTLTVWWSLKTPISTKSNHFRHTHPAFFPLLNNSLIAFSFSFCFSFSKRSCSFAILLAFCSLLSFLPPLFPFPFFFFLSLPFLLFFFFASCSSQKKTRAINVWTVFALELLQWWTVKLSGSHDLHRFYSTQYFWWNKNCNIQLHEPTHIINIYNIYIYINYIL